jgi:hypothetical protein
MEKYRLNKVIEPRFGRRINPYIDSFLWITLGCEILFGFYTDNWDRNILKEGINSFILSTIRTGRIK